MTQKFHIPFGILTVWIMTFGLGSCASEDTPIPGASTKLAPEEMLVRDYYSFVHGKDATRASAENIRITNVEATQYRISDETAKIAEITDKKDRNFTLKSVSVDFGDSEGFAILSDDDRINRVFFYTESGCLSDTADIKALKEIIDSYPKLAENIIKEKYDSKETLTRGQYLNQSEILVNPIVRFQWGQGFPFNNASIYCTSGNCGDPRYNYRNHMPIGCGNIAMAMTIATIGKFKGTYYGTRHINFNELPNKGYQMTAAQETIIGHFLQEIAINCQTKFNCSGSSTIIEADANYLRDLGYTCNIEKGAINTAKTIELLKKGIPHLMRGTDSSGGHMWIIDGVGVKNGQYSYNCNWGWNGSCNGWTIGEVFEAKTSDYDYIFSKDHKHLYITSF